MIGCVFLNENRYGKTDRLMDYMRTPATSSFCIIFTRATRGAGFDLLVFRLLLCQNVRHKFRFLQCVLKTATASGHASAYTRIKYLYGTGIIIYLFIQSFNFCRPHTIFFFGRIKEDVLALLCYMKYDIYAYDRRRRLQQ